MADLNKEKGVCIQNISFHYPRKKYLVFSDFSLSLEQSGVYCLLGANGVGKSTLLYLISGLLLPKKGTIHVNGSNVKNRNPDFLRDIFLIPEEFELPAVSLNAFMRTNSFFYPNFSEKVYARCLADFNLTKDLNFGSLSMGQKKKAYLAFALAARVKFLLMDEPTNGLDIPSKKIFRKVVAENCSEDQVVLISTHQVQDVESLLDYVVVLNDREVLLKASVSDIAASFLFESRSSSAVTEDALFVQTSMNGNMVLLRNEQHIEQTRIDWELLFTALLSKPSLANYLYIVKQDNL